MRSKNAMYGQAITISSEINKEREILGTKGVISCY